MKKINLLFLVLIGIVYFLVFRVFFLNINPVFGDAPNFTSNLINTYLNIPELWRARADNFGGIPIGDIALSGLMMVYSLVHRFLGLDNQYLLKIIFYFPATILAFLGAYFFSGLFLKEKIARLIASFFYTFNTYFLLLIDGGQVGVALGYGIAPFVLYQFINVFKKFIFKDFLVATALFLVLTNIEVRFSVVILLTFLVYVLAESFFEKRFEIKKFIFLVPVILVSLAVDLFWIYPLLEQQGKLVKVFSDLTLISLKNSLFLFQPHWFLNEFGHITTIPLYFLGLPLLILLSFVLKRDGSSYKFGVIFLFFTFLAKGGSPPLGQIYSSVINNVPYMNIFRDSSKFFLPLLLVGGVLIGRNLEVIKKKRPKAYIISSLVLLIYLTFLISPAVLGRMTGVLGVDSYDTKEYDYINSLVRETSGGRFLFFRAKPAFVQEDYPSEMLNGDLLYKTRPFATLIEGVYDKYYFLWNPVFPKLIDLAGINYMFFPPDLNKKTYSEKDLAEREYFEASVSAELKGEKILNLSFPGYKINPTTPKIFSVKKTILVVGPDDIYERLFSGNNSRMLHTPLIFLEDGDWDTESLMNINKGDLEIFLNQKGKEDILYRVLKGEVLDASLTTKSNWGEKHETIEWRDEARKSGIVTHDFDLGKGVLFSNIRGEISEFKFNQEVASEMNLVLRALGNNSSASLLIDGRKVSETKMEESNNFNYYPIEKIYLSKGEHKISVINEGGFVMLNLIKIYTDDEYNRANIFTTDLLKKFRTVPISPLTSDNLVRLDFNQVSETEYKLNEVRSPWIFMSENYHPGWELEGAFHYPAYSFMNAYYVPKGVEANKIYFAPQQKALTGVKMSLGSGLVVIALSCVGLLYRRKIEKLLN